jgi:hypothetical protein
MIKQIILSTALVVGTAQGTENRISDDTLMLAMNDKPKYDVWNPSMGKKESGESCKDGNCFEKDGKVYKFFTKFRDKVKKQCRKL